VHEDCGCKEDWVEECERDVVGNVNNMYVCEHRTRQPIARAPRSAMMDGCVLSHAGARGLTPGSVLRHTLGSLTLASPCGGGGPHGGEWQEACMALPDPLDAPSYVGGMSQELGLFWCAAHG